MIKVFTAGGIGNQLFQFAFAHVLSKHSDSDVEIVQFQRTADLEHTRQTLNSIGLQCNHLKIKVINKQPLLQIFDPWTRIRHHLNISDTRNDPFLSLSDFYSIKSLKKKYIGYFQNQDFVFEVRNELLKDLGSIVATGIIFREKYGSYEVIHVRGGDYRTPQKKDKFGVLADSYYREVLSRSNSLKRFVITDDLDLAKSFKSIHPFEEIFGPTDLNPRNCLALMSGAELLVAANSTFSWWGGFLTSSTGGKVIFPEPIFKSKALNSGKALNYPNFEFANAVFL